MAPQGNRQFGTSTEAVPERLWWRCNLSPRKTAASFGGGGRFKARFPGQMGCNSSSGIVRLLARKSNSIAAV